MKPGRLAAGAKKGWNHERGERPGAAFGRKQNKLNPTAGLARPERILCVFASLRLCVSSFLQAINDSQDPIFDQLRAEIDQKSRTRDCQSTGSPKKRALAKAQRRKGKSARRGVL